MDLSNIFNNTFTELYDRKIAIVIPGSIQIWNYEKKELVSTLEGHTTDITSLLKLENGRIV